MQSAPSHDGPVPARFRAAAILILTCGFLGYVALTWRWPLTGDSQVMHYVSFLTDHGFAPYREIGDMNMPGAYLFDRWALAIFGHSDFGWRLYDYTLTVALGGGMVWIAKRYDWMAGLTAAVVFALTHGADGPPDAGQRDQLIAVLLVLACAALFESVRKRQAWWMLPFAFVSMLAAAVKPTFLPFAPVLFLCAAVELRRSRVALKAYLSAAIAGSVAAFVLVLAFLMEHHATKDFLLLFTRTLPHYQTLESLSWTQMLGRSLPLTVALVAVAGFVTAFLLHKKLWNWEWMALLLAAALGELSYLVQRKGFQQHRYTLIAFLLLWAAIQLWTALPHIGVARATAYAGLLACAVYIVPIDLYRTHSYPTHDDFTEFLQADLARLGTDRLQRNIQCLDIIDGCLTALFHLDIVQSTGATGDLLLFQPVPAPQVDDARAIYSQWSRAHPPDVYVLSNFYFGQPQRDFDRVHTWPAFSADLNSNYVLAVQREFRSPPTSNPGTNPNVPGYRIYIRRGSSMATIR